MTCDKVRTNDIRRRLSYDCQVSTPVNFTSAPIRLLMEKSSTSAFLHIGVNINHIEVYAVSVKEHAEIGKSRSC